MMRRIRFWSAICCASVCVAGCQFLGAPQPRSTVGNTYGPPTQLGAPAEIQDAVPRISDYETNRYTVPPGGTSDGIGPQPAQTNRFPLETVPRVEPLDVQPLPEGELTIEPIPAEPQPTEVPNPELPRLLAPEVERSESRLVPAPLELDVQAEGARYVGQKVVFGLTVRNSGDKELTNVYLDAEFPAALVFPGSEQRYVQKELGTLAAGESDTVALTLYSDVAGKHCVRFAAGADGIDEVNEESCVEFQETPLSLHVLGPEERVQGQAVEYNLRVAAATAIPSTEVVLSYDTQMLKPLAGSAGAVLKPGEIRWALKDLKNQETVLLHVEFRTLANTNKTCVTLAASLTDGPDAAIPIADAEKCLAVAVPDQDLSLSLADGSDPVRLGEETDVTFRVMNTSLDAMSGLEVSVEIPDFLRVLQASVSDGTQDLPIKSKVENGKVTFDLVEELAANDVLVFRLQTKALRAGDGDINATLKRDGAEDTTMREIVSAVR